LLTWLIPPILLIVKQFSERCFFISTPEKSKKIPEAKNCQFLSLIVWLSVLVRLFFVEVFEIQKIKNCQFFSFIA
jgi:hypothetical protein